METRSFSHRYFKSKQNLLNEFPPQLVEFFKKSAVNLLLDDEPLSEEKQELFKKLQKANDLRSIMKDREFGRYTQWIEDDGSITIHQKIKEKSPLYNEVYIEQVLHEIGHLLEATDDRVFLPDWGLKWPVNYAKSTAIPDSGFRRELKVGVYDTVLRRMLNIPIKQEYFYTTRTVIYAALGFNNEKRMLEFPELQYLRDTMRCYDVSDAVIQYTKDEADKISDEMLMTEWNRKNDLIRQNMSQKVETVRPHKHGNFGV